jgi:amino acid permease
LGAGTLTIPMVVAQNGIILGSILITIGAVISYYTGMLLINCSQKTGTDRYEDFAIKAYGEKAGRATSYIVIVCLLGFVIAYIVLVLNFANL